MGLLIFVSRGRCLAVQQQYIILQKIMDQMETPILQGKKLSSLYFNKIDIYADRIEAKGILIPRKIIYRKDITSWTEVTKRQSRAGITWLEFTIYTAKTEYKIMSMYWANYNEMKAELSAGKIRDTAKETKINNSFW
jgi:hypothetical protein